MATDDLISIGVDVGGTNTDAVVIHNRALVTWSKVPTTDDITSGIASSVRECLDKLPQEQRGKKVRHISIGTTHFINAVAQRRSLAKVAVVRLCGPASLALPPYSDFPEDLKRTVYGGHHMINGGYEFDGSVITDVRKEEVVECARELEKAGIKHIVVSGIFSPINPQQEIDVAELLKEELPKCSITLAHTVGQMGLLERENASVLNECLKPLCKTTIRGFAKGIVEQLRLDCPFYLTQNDGTLISAQECLEYPVRTFASGATNSMRGAAFLSGEENAVVADIGGTTTDVGVLQHGFPREANNRVKVGGVNTNFIMPDLFSIALGGGSLVRERDQRMVRETQCVATPMKVGPESLGNRLVQEALVFGGQVLTATDVVAASGLVTSVGDWKRARDSMPKCIVDSAMLEIADMLERAIDSVKVTADEQPLILVGGGSILIDERQVIPGVSKILKPKHFQVANAVGAALSQIGHCVDKIYCYELEPRDECLKRAKADATRAVVEAGACPQSVHIVEVDETPLAYSGQGAHRVRVKAVGDLFDNTRRTEVCLDIGSPPPLKSPAMPKLCKFDEFSDFEPGAVMTDPVSNQPFDVDASTGEWFLTERDVECICLGAGILGCGGGGSPYLARLRVLRLLREGKKIRIIDPSWLGSRPELDGVVALVAFMGAPTVITEKLISGKEICGAVRYAEKIYGADVAKCGVSEKQCEGYKEIAPEDLDKLCLGPETKRVVAIMCGEIGGLNAAEPLAVAAEMDLPVVDCDGMGRAFPELQMCYPFITGQVGAYPASLMDEKGVCFAVSHADSGKALENFFRVSVMKMGCKGGVCLSVMTPGQVQQHAVQRSYSRAWRLGHAVLRAREQKVSPVALILKSVQGQRLINGKIVDVQRNTEGGFVRGRLKIQGLGRYRSSMLYIKFQNENLIAEFSEQDDDEDESCPSSSSSVVATTPDLISILESETGEPISTEEVRYGLRVVVIAIGSTPEMRTEESLACVGPKYFGYECEYTPLCESPVHVTPIPPPRLDSN